MFIVSENGTDVATYVDKGTAEATACQHICEQLPEMKEQIALIEELIRRGNSARALVAYQSLRKTIPNIRMRRR